MTNNKLKQKLDNLVEKYETKSFITEDPIQFPHRYKRREDIEIAAFLASIFSYGNRKIFVSKLNDLFDYFGNSVLDFLLNKNLNSEFLNNFDYRFSKGIDLIQILTILKELYKKSSLMELFENGYNHNQDIKQMFRIVTNYFYSRVTMPVTNGFYHLLPNPQKNSAMKRMCMFLRWLVRDGDVDFGIWKFIPKSKLIIPLDVHVARLSRELGLLNKKNNDYCAVCQLMNNLSMLDCEDPVKYDFALFGYGIEHK